MNKSTRTAIVEPILLLLKSRRFIVALSAVAIGLLSMLLPDLEAVRSELLTLTITIALTLIGGYSLEDAAEAARKRPPELDEATITELVNNLITESIQEWQKPPYTGHMFTAQEFNPLRQKEP